MSLDYFRVSTFFQSQYTGATDEILQGEGGLSLIGRTDVALYTGRDSDAAFLFPRNNPCERVYAANLRRRDGGSTDSRALTPASASNRTRRAHHATMPTGFLEGFHQSGVSLSYDISSGLRFHNHRVPRLLIIDSAPACGPGGAAGALGRSTSFAQVTRKG